MTASNRRWLLLVHQLPARPSNLRVQTWRRLQQLGAIPVKQAVYALPDTPEAREDFEWLKAEITGAGGEATVFAADNVDAWSDEALVKEFKRTREALYKELGRDLEHALARVRSEIVRIFVGPPVRLPPSWCYSCKGRRRPSTFSGKLETCRHGKISVPPVGRRGIDIACMK